MRISDFEWDEGNSLHLQFRHGVEPEEVEQVFADKPLFRKTKKETMRFLAGHWAEHI